MGRRGAGEPRRGVEQPPRAVKCRENCSLTRCWRQPLNSSSGGAVFRQPDADAHDLPHVQVDLHLVLL
jgi:hypothetical protein